MASYQQRTQQYPSAQQDGGHQNQQYQLQPLQQQPMSPISLQGHGNNSQPGDGARPTIPAPPSLPPGWAAHWDKSQQKYYYHNTGNGKTTWDYPQANPPPTPPATADSMNASRNSQFTENQTSHPSGMRPSATPAPISTYQHSNTSPASVKASISPSQGYTQPSLYATTLSRKPVSDHARNPTPAPQSSPSVSTTSGSVGIFEAPGSEPTATVSPITGMDTGKEICAETPVEENAQMSATFTGISNDPLFSDLTVSTGLPAPPPSSMQTTNIIRVAMTPSPKPASPAPSLQQPRPQLPPRPANVPLLHQRTMSVPPAANSGFQPPKGGVSMSAPGYGQGPPAQGGPYKSQHNSIPGVQNMQNIASPPPPYEQTGNFNHVQDPGMRKPIQRPAAAAPNTGMQRLQQTGNQRVNTFPQNQNQPPRYPRPQTYTKQQFQAHNANKSSLGATTKTLLDKLWSADLLIPLKKKMEGVGNGAPVGGNGRGVVRGRGIVRGRGQLQRGQLHVGRGRGAVGMGGMNTGAGVNMGMGNSGMGMSQDMNQSMNPPAEGANMNQGQGIPISRGGGNMVRGRGTLRGQHMAISSGRGTGGSVPQMQMQQQQQVIPQTGMNMVHNSIFQHAQPQQSVNQNVQQTLMPQPGTGRGAIQNAIPGRGGGIQVAGRGRGMVQGIGRGRGNMGGNMGMQQQQEQQNLGSGSLQQAQQIQNQQIVPHQQAHVFGGGGAGATQAMPQQQQQQNIGSGGLQQAQQMQNQQIALHQQVHVFGNGSAGAAQAMSQQQQQQQQQGAQVFASTGTPNQSNVKPLAQQQPQFSGNDSMVGTQVQLQQRPSSVQQQQSQPQVLVQVVNAGIGGGSPLQLQQRPPNVQQQPQNFTGGHNGVPHTQIVKPQSQNVNNGNTPNPQVQQQQQLVIQNTQKPQIPVPQAGRGILSPNVQNIPNGRGVLPANVQKIPNGRGIPANAPLNPQAAALGRGRGGAGRGRGGPQNRINQQQGMQQQQSGFNPLAAQVGLAVAGIGINQYMAQERHNDMMMQQQQQQGQQGMGQDPMVGQQQQQQPMDQQMQQDGSLQQQAVDQQGPQDACMQQQQDPATQQDPAIQQDPTMCEQQGVGGEAYPPDQYAGDPYAANQTGDMYAADATGGQGDMYAADATGGQGDMYAADATGGQGDMYTTGQTGEYYATDQAGDMYATDMAGGQGDIYAADPTGGQGEMGYEQETYGGDMGYGQDTYTQGEMSYGQDTCGGDMGYSQDITIESSSQMTVEGGGGCDGSMMTYESTTEVNIEQTGGCDQYGYTQMEETAYYEGGYQDPNAYDQGGYDQTGGDGAYYDDGTGGGDGAYNDQAAAEGEYYADYGAEGGGYDQGAEGGCMDYGGGDFQGDIGGDGCGDYTAGAEDLEGADFGGMTEAVSGEGSGILASLGEALGGLSM